MLTSEKADRITSSNQPVYNVATTRVRFGGEKQAERLKQGE